MPGVPVITLKSISNLRTLENLVAQYPQYKEAILKQLLEPSLLRKLFPLFDIEKFVTLFSEYKTLLSKSILSPNMLQFFSEGERGAARIAALVRAFPEQKENLAVKMLHMDTFTVFADSPIAVKQLIDLFPEHKNGISNLLLNKNRTMTRNLNHVFTCVRIRPFENRKQHLIIYFANLS